MREPCVRSASGRCPAPGRLARRRGVGSGCGRCSLVLREGSGAGGRGEGLCTTLAGRADAHACAGVRVGVGVHAGVSQAWGSPVPATALATAPPDPCARGLLLRPVEAGRGDGGWAFRPAFRSAQPRPGRNLVLVFHFLVAFVHSEITETHFIANGIPFQEKERTGFFFLRDKLLRVRDFWHQRKAYLLYPPKSAMPALKLTS